MNNHNSIERIISLLMLLTTQERDDYDYDPDNNYIHLITAHELSHRLSIPVEQIINDLRSLFSYRRLRENLIIYSAKEGFITYDGDPIEDDDDDDDDDLTDADYVNFFKTVDWAHDSFGWKCNKLILDNLHPIILDRIQDTLLNSAFPELCLDNENQNAFAIADNNELPPDIRQIERDIEQVIRNNKNSAKKRLLVFEYKSNASDSFEKIEIIPRLISCNTENDRVYCIATEGTQILFYRLDSIKKGSLYTKPLLNASVYNDYDPAALSHFDYMWAMDHDSSIPTHVKLWINGETRNIIEKIASDTRRRKFKKLYKDPANPGFWYYEDDIIGLSAFRRWIRQYGSSIKVIEPQELSEQLIQNAKDILKNYGVM